MENTKNSKVSVKTENTKTTVKNAQLKVATMKQTGDADFGLEEKTLHYLLIITDKGQLRINVGEKTITTIKELIS